MREVRLHTKLCRLLFNCHLVFPALTKRISDTYSHLKSGVSDGDAARRAGPGLQRDAIDGRTDALAFVKRL